jgi:hypothetical protein
MRRFPRSFGLDNDTATKNGLGIPEAGHNGLGSLGRQVEGCAGPGVWLGGVRGDGLADAVNAQRIGVAGRAGRAAGHDDDPVSGAPERKSAQLRYCIDVNNKEHW